MRDQKVIAPILLDWYDTYARDLPWRVKPRSNQPVDPYRVWLSEIMLQQTTVAAVKSYFERFTHLWPDVQSLAAAEDDRVMAEWAGLGYYARARNLLACARAVVAQGGFPRDHAGLLALPGIGPYTAAAISSIAYDQPETVVDGNVERVVARLFGVQTPLPVAKPELTRLAATLTPKSRPGDYAQAMMDLGATICTPRSPACAICPVMAECDAKALGIAAELPQRVAKKPKPMRQGTAWVGLDRGHVLVERRDDRGLLGGTLAFPSSGWDGSMSAPPAPANWVSIGQIRHVFTHFTLDLEVHIADPIGPAERGYLTPLDGFERDDLPGLMRKVWDLAQSMR